MKINFTKAQYTLLLKAIYLGNWFINAIRDDPIAKYDALEQYIFSFAKEFGLEEYVEFDDEENECFPTRAFEEDEEIERFLEEYDEHTFWSELIDRLAQGDFWIEYGEDAMKDMDQIERVEKMQPFLEAYTKEFEKAGNSPSKL